MSQATGADRVIKPSNLTIVPRDRDYQRQEPTLVFRTGVYLYRDEDGDIQERGRGDGRVFRHTPNRQTARLSGVMRRREMDRPGWTKRLQARIAEATA